MAGLLAGMVAACSDGDTESGGAVTLAPGGNIEKDTTTVINQAGTYNLPETGLVDIQITCNTANVDVTANSPVGPQTLTANCSMGTATIVGHAGGGTLDVVFNLGSGFSVRVVDSSQLP